VPVPSPTELCALKQGKRATEPRSCALSVNRLWPAAQTIANEQILLAPAVAPMAELLAAKGDGL
jgi:hypothetical protein